MSFDFRAVQQDLKAARLDGWLFYDFRGRDPIAHRILQLPPGMRTRRWFYFVPTKGAPRKLVHKIEAESLAALPGETLYYASQNELQANLQELVDGAQSIAMQYSPRNAIPYVSIVDAGTIELVRSVGPRIYTSADLVQKYEACWTAEQLESHLAAGEAVDVIIREAFQLAAKGARDGKPLTEYVLKQWILKRRA
jgi:Xaa-Pro dipeptidase